MGVQRHGSNMSRVPPQKNSIYTSEISHGELQMFECLMYYSVPNVGNTHLQLLMSFLPQVPQNMFYIVGDEQT